MPRVKTCSDVYLLHRRHLVLRTRLLVPVVLVVTFAIVQRMCSHRRGYPTLALCLEGALTSADEIRNLGEASFLDRA